MNEKFLQGLDECIVRGMKQLNVPGASIAITRGGKLLFSKAFGYADLEKEAKMETTTLLPIGSSSKSFTAAAAVMLAGDGKIDLDKPIRTYMPEFELADPIAAREATARDLLCHRTGLPRHDLMWIDWNELTRKDLVENRIRHLQPSKPFRSTWQYQNHMFATMGYLIERVSGKPWEDFVKDRIFKPLGISNYSFRADYANAKQSYARLYTEDDDKRNKENPPLLLDAIGPAGSIHCTAEQVAKYVRFMLNKGKAGKKKLIDDKLFPELVTPNIPYHLLPFDVPNQISVGYALGWFVDSYRGHRVVNHGGNVSGGTAMVSMMPDDDIGCVILVNADSSMFGMALASEIFDRFLNVKDKTEWFDFYDGKYKALIDEMMAKLNEIFDSKKEGKQPSHDLSEYAGTYTHPGYGEITVSCQGEGLSAKYHSFDLKLSHLHYDIFTFILHKMPLSVSFTSNVKGEIDALAIPFESSADPIVFKAKKES